MDDDFDVVPEVRVGPAYNTNAWTLSDSRGPQCSQSGEFCFLCQFLPRKCHDEYDEEETEITDDDPTQNCDWVKRIKNSISALVAEKIERPKIVQHIHLIYKKHIQEHIEYINPFTNAVVRAPAWTHSAIDRHLVHSQEWPDLFESTIDQTFHAILDTQNMRMRDMDTEDIIEDRRKAYMDSIKHFVEWKKYRASQTNSIKRKTVSAARKLSSKHK